LPPIKKPAAPKKTAPKAIPLPPPPPDQGFGTGLSERISKESAARKKSQASGPPEIYMSPGDKERMANQKRIVAQGNADRARIAAQKAKRK
jgi:hypothetical protein